MNNPNIEGVDLYKLLNGEFVQLGDQVVDLVKKYDPNVLKVLPLFTTFSAKMAEIAAVYKVLEGSPLTILIDKADNRRDRAISGISLSVEAKQFSYIPAEVEAAQLFRRHIDKYGTGIARQNLLLETANIKNLVKDTKEIPELKAAVSVLGLTVWVDELEAANSEFEAMFANRTAELSKVPIDAMRQRRLEGYDLYYKLRDKLLSQSNVNDYVAPFADAMLEWNAMLAPYNRLIALRMGKDKPSDTPPPTA